MDRELVDNAIEQAYDAALGDTGWDDAVCALVRAHRADRAIMFTPSVEQAKGGLWVLHEVPIEIQRRYVYEYRERDLWLAEGISRGEFRAGNTVLGHDLVMPAQLKRSEIYADVLKSAGLFHLCSSILSDGSDKTTPPSLFALFRGERAEPFTTHDQRSFNRTCRHVSRAVRMWFRGTSCRAGASILSDALDAAAVLLDTDLNVAWMNRSAEDMARSGRLRLHENRLRAVAGYEHALGPLVARAIKAGAFVDSGTSDAAVTLEFFPASFCKVTSDCTATPHRPRSQVLMLIRALPGHNVTASLMSGLHLTRSEADLAVAITDGASLSEHARARGVSISTVRSQLKAVLRKTECRRQSQVVTLVNRIRPILASRASDEAATGK